MTMPNPDQSSERRAFDHKWVEEQRPLFEAEMRKLYQSDAYYQRRPKTGAYVNRRMSDAWVGWLARSAIPTVVSEEMVDRMAPQLCHYAYPSDFNSCCSTEMGNKRCQVEARACLTAALTVSSEREG